MSNDIPSISNSKEIKGLLQIYRQAVKNVPILKYGWVIIATIIILALASYFKLEDPKVFLYAILTLVISFIGFLFSYLLKTTDKFIRYLLYFLITCIVITIATGIISFGTYIIWSVPKSYDNLFLDKTEDLKEKQDTLKNKPIPVTIEDSIISELKKRTFILGEMMKSELYPNDINTLQAIFRGNNSVDKKEKLSIKEFYLLEEYKDDGCEKLINTLNFKTKFAYDSSVKAFKDSFWIFDSLKLRSFNINQKDKTTLAVKLSSGDSLIFYQNIYPKLLKYRS